MTLVTLRIAVQGRSFWVDRGAFFDVLFPDDGVPRGEQGGGGAEHHYVTIDGPGISSLDALTGHCLDCYSTTTGLTQPFAGSTLLDQPGWLDIPVVAGSPASDPDTVFNGRGIIAALRLPRGEVNQFTSLDGPFDVAGGRFAYLGWGVQYFCVLDGTSGVTAELRAFGSPDKPSISLSSPGSTNDISIVVISLSDADRSGGTQPLMTGMMLPDTAPLFTVAGQHPIPPVYQGPTRTGSNIKSLTCSHSKGGGRTFTLTNGEKPCPAGKGT